MTVCPVCSTPPVFPVGPVGLCRYAECPKCGFGNELATGFATEELARAFWIGAVEAYHVYVLKTRNPARDQGDTVWSLRVVNHGVGKEDKS